MSIFLQCRTIALGAAMTLIAFSAHSSDKNDLKFSSGIYADFAGLERENSDRDNKIENLLAPIKSQADLASYLGSTPIQKSPIAKLSLGGQRRFLKSLTFNEKGLTGFDYGDIARELSATQAYQLLRLFGMQHLTSTIDGLRVSSPLDQAIMQGQNNICPPKPSNDPQCPGGDRKGYYCAVRATCQPNPTGICTSNC